MQPNWYAIVTYTLAMPCKQCGGRDFHVEYDTQGWHWERAKCKACELVQDVRPPNARS